MTGAPGGTHRWRVVGAAGGVHWWRGGPAGGGSHAAGGPGLRHAVLGLLLVAVLAGGVLIALARSGPGTPAPADTAPADSASADSASADPASAGAPGLQARIDAATAAAPMRFAPGAPDPLPGPGLEPLAAVLRESPHVVAVEGHTAPVGADGTRSEQLSRLRAESVARGLVALGVDPARLRVVAMGDSRPLPTIDASRRVEVRAGG